MEPEADGISFRPYVEDDINFIYSSWGNSYYDDETAWARARNKLCPTPTEFHAIHRPVIDHFFVRPTATVIVVHHVDEPSVIIGWIAVEPLETSLIIHYINVRGGEFRRRGIMGRLLKVVDQGKPIIYTHRTEKISKIIKNNPEKYKHFNYQPLT